MSLGRDEIRSTRLTILPGSVRQRMQSGHLPSKRRGIAKAWKARQYSIHNIFETHPDVFEKRILFQWTRKYLTLQQTW